jgi:16S rRNA pseudouridine516 synthase
MLVAAGNHCVFLRRAQIGLLKLDDLKLAVGEWCYLGDAELALLKPV